MSGTITCPNPQCPQPTKVQYIVLSGTGSMSPNSARAKAQRRRVNRRLMEPRTMFATWGVAGGLSGLLVLVGMYLLAFGPTSSIPGTRLIEALAAWVVAAVLMVWSRRSLAHPSVPTRFATSPRQQTGLYLCDGCGSVFEPVSGRFTPLERAGELFA